MTKVTPVGYRCYGFLGDRYLEADILTHLGDSHHVTGSLQAAREAWRQALTILDDLHHSNADHIRTKLATLDTYRTDQPPGE